MLQFGDIIYTEPNKSNTHKLPLIRDEGSGFSSTSESELISLISSNLFETKSGIPISKKCDFTLNSVFCIRS